jgi:ribosomal protein L29
MSPEVTAVWIAAGVGVLTVAATVAAQYFGRRATSRDTQKTLAEQSEQLDSTLAEQRTRTLNERFAAAAGQLGSDKPPEVRLAGMPWRAWRMTGRRTGRPALTCCAVICACV